MDARTRREKLEEHLEAIRRLEASEVEPTRETSWPPSGYYLLWHVVVGMMMGGVGAMVSLIANIAGAPLFGELSVRAMALCFCIEFQEVV